jgi:hypothetical protein
MELVKETATCEYLVVIHTPRLCNDQSFKVETEEAQQIVCQPVYMMDPELSHLNPDKEKLQIPPDFGTDAYYKRLNDMGERPLTPVLYPITQHGNVAKRPGIGHGEEFDSDSDSDFGMAADVSDDEGPNKRFRSGSPQGFKTTKMFPAKGGKMSGDDIKQMLKEMQKLTKFQDSDDVSDERVEKIRQTVQRLQEDGGVEVVVLDGTGKPKRMKLNEDIYEQVAKKLHEELFADMDDDDDEDEQQRKKKAPQKARL